MDGCLRISWEGSVEMKGIEPVSIQRLLTIQPLLPVSSPVVYLRSCISVLCLRGFRRREEAYESVLIDRVMETSS